MEGLERHELECKSGTQPPFNCYVVFFRAFTNELGKWMDVNAIG